VFRSTPINAFTPARHGAAEWTVEAWTRLPKGMEAPTVENLEGLVVVLFCFQSW